MSIRILAIAEQKDGKLSNVSYELPTVAQKVGGELMTACLAENADALAAELVSRGGGKVLAISNPALKYYNDEVYTRVITELIKKYQPQLVIASATFYGKALMSRLAALNEGAMVSDITGVSADGDRVTISRPAYGGNVTMDVIGSDDKILFATVRPKVFNEASGDTGEVVAETVDSSLFDTRTTVKEMVVESGQSVNLMEADIIVSAGRGVRAPENVEMVKKLADALGAAFGASRAIVDADWTEYRHQVGQTGKTVNPKLYFAIGISGAIQHLVGMQSSKAIVAINRDKDAPIFKVATYGIVGDLFEIVPALIGKFEANK
ncbi:MAG: electron transfer flavoprotein subunit alpha/FixB family protein [Candidatus Zixiibacteriota bacterium]|nr:MAG: electron transfer flavoprotein subunit alpha/FixB family protein [candidate division Zixibacteria bacterium]